MGVLWQQHEKWVLIQIVSENPHFTWVERAQIFTDRLIMLYGQQRTIRSPHALHRQYTRISNGHLSSHIPYLIWEVEQVRKRSMQLVGPTDYILSMLPESAPHCSKTSTPREDT